MMAAAKPSAKTPSDVTKDWNFATTYEGEALNFIRDHLWRKFCRDSTCEEDLRQSTDYVVESPAKVRIAMRIRRIENARSHRDFTLRMSRPSGRKTELAKLAENPLDFYCYCWIDGTTRRLDEYLIVDMKKFMASGLLSTPDGVKANRDGSATFALWDWRTLQDAKCVLEGVKYPWGPISYRLDAEYEPANQSSKRVTSA